MDRLTGPLNYDLTYVILFINGAIKHICSLYAPLLEQEILFTSLHFYSVTLDTPSLENGLSGFDTT